MPPEDTNEKNPIAQAMVALRNEKLSPARKKQIAKDAAEARWAGHVKAGDAPKAKAKRKAAKKRAGK